MSSRSRSRSRRDEQVQRVATRVWCTWLKIIFLVILLVVAGVLVWMLGPWNDDKPQYQFIQCDTRFDPDNTNTNTNTGQIDCCHGLEGICDLRVDEVMYATLHNGMASIEDLFIGNVNHKYNVEEALEAGYRGLNLDICNCYGEVVFCHGEYVVYTEYLTVGIQIARNKVRRETSIKKR